MARISPGGARSSGRLGRHLPLVGGGPASAASRMGRAWARMGRAAPTLSVWATWHALPMQRHAGPMRGVRAAGPRLSVGRLARSGLASAAPRMGRAWARMGRAAPTRGCMCSPCSGPCGPMRGVLVAGPRLSVGRSWRARVSRGPHAPRMVQHGPMHERLDGMVEAASVKHTTRAAPSSTQSQWMDVQHNAQDPARSHACVRCKRERDRPRR
jgi:hypothetical protein